jgi:hypothetical protein
VADSPHDRIIASSIGHVPVQTYEATFGPAGRETLKMTYTTDASGRHVVEINESYSLAARSCFGHVKDIE